MENTASQSSMPDQLIIKSESSSSKGSVQLPQMTLKKRKQRISSQLQNIMKPRTRAKKKYFTAAPGINEDNAIDLDKEPSPYKYPDDLDQFAYKVMRKSWREDARVKELQAKCHQKPSYQIRQRKGLLKRLYVNEPKPTAIQTVLDIDPQYFSVIEGKLDEYCCFL